MGGVVEDTLDFVTNDVPEFGANFVGGITGRNQQRDAALAAGDRQAAASIEAGGMQADALRDRGMNNARAIQQAGGIGIRGRQQAGDQRMNQFANTMALYNQMTGGGGGGKMGVPGQQPSPNQMMMGRAMGGGK